MPPETVAHYRLRERLGSGAMGEVWLAEDTRLHRLVALKMLPAKDADDAEAAARLLREARVASSLSHPNVAVVYDVGETEHDGQQGRLRRDGVREGPHALAAAGGRADGRRRHPAHRPPGGGGARRRARARRRPPGREARQRDGERARPREGARLRPRPLRPARPRGLRHLEREPRRPRGRDRGDARLHVAGAGPRPRRRRAERRLLARACCSTSCSPAAAPSTGENARRARRGDPHEEPAAPVRGGAARRGPLPARRADAREGPGAPSRRHGRGPARPRRAPRRQRPRPRAGARATRSR